MTHEFWNGGPKYDAVMKGIITNHFSNSEDVLKSDEQHAFEKAVAEGRVEVITQDDIRDTYKGQYFKAEKIAEFEKAINELTAKGEKDFLTEAELASLEKGITDLKNLQEKAVVVKKGESQTYHRIFVLPAEPAAKAE